LQQKSTTVYPWTILGMPYIKWHHCSHAGYPAG
jgi:hypothetical protein